MDARGGFVGPIIEPLAQALVEGIPFPQSQQGGHNGRLAGALSEDRAIDPQDEATPLGRAQVRQVLRKGLVHLATRFGKAHGTPPV